MGSAHLANHRLHLTGGACMSIYYIGFSRRLNGGCIACIDETTTGPVSPPSKY